MISINKKDAVFVNAQKKKHLLQSIEKYFNNEFFHETADDLAGCL